jgi:phenylacetate-CoA ligase
MTNLLQLYHQLPYPLRVVAATARGHYLGRWRYTAQTEALVEQILERDYWTAEQWQTWQEERLATMLHRAATQTPYYRQHWQERRRRGDRASWELLANWPIVTKEHLRKQARAFVADDCDIRHMFYEHTSGTTGKALDIWLSKETVRNWFAIFEARSRHWYGVSRRDRWAILGGQLVTPVEQQHPPFWVWNAALNQLYLSSYHLSARNIPAYLEAIARHDIVYILGYPSAVYRLAQGALEQKLEMPRLKVALSNAEPLYDHQRRAIGEAFQCPVRETYGMAEIVAAAGECPAGQLHGWPDVGIVEVLDDFSETAAPPGTVGRFITTGLLNADMPLVRYEVGDRGAVDTQAEDCSCGRLLPTWKQLDGGIRDVVVTADGRYISCLDIVFTAGTIREAQIIQEDVEQFRVKYVPGVGYTAQDGEIMVQRLHQRVGPVNVVLEPVAEIPRMANGKFRVVVSHLLAGQQDRVGQCG